MKKLLALLLAGIMIFALVGCNGAEVSEETDNSEVLEEELDESEEVVDKINMTYGDDETKITLHKPDGAFFSVDAEDAEDAGDIVIMLADDYSWDAEIMGYKHFEGISSNEPFVEYYFDGAASDDYTFYEQEAIDLGIDFEGISSNEPFVEYYFDGAASDDYTFYEQEATDLGIEYEGKPVKLIRYTYKEVDDEEEYKACFVGFEYKGTEDSGLFGLKIGSFEEDLSDSYIKGLFNQLFALEK